MKSALCLILSLVMLLTATACGGAAEPVSAPEPPQESASSSQASPPESEPESEPESTAESEPESEPEPVSESEPEPEPEPEPQPQGVSFSIETMGADGTDPGEVVIIRVKNLPQGVSVGLNTPLTTAPTFFDDGQGGKAALMPVSYHTLPGDYPLTIYAGEESAGFTLTVRQKKFPEQHLTVDPDTTSATMENPEATAEYRRVIYPLLSIVDDTQYWSGRFILPVDESAEVTTAFGTIRYTNGAASSTRHDGVDLALELGNPVAAANAGRVVFAGYLLLVGNTVMIEHGHGLKTWYYHMDSYCVETGDMVEQGQKIGEVGSTGFSTGPHLHFNMDVRGTMINPYTAIQSDFLNW